MANLEMIKYCAPQCHRNKEAKFLVDDSTCRDIAAKQPDLAKNTSGPGKGC